jgi:dTDP-4-amino-4,6-dideoxygalactose transaminase
VGDLRFLVDDVNSRCVYHQMTVLTDRRDDLRQHLDRAGVGTVVHYPLAVHRQPAFADRTESDGLEVAEAAGDQVLCLPMFPELTEQEIEQVCTAVRGFFE